jgi:hypothetical protein
MNPKTYKPTGDPSGVKPQLDLQRAYAVLIRAYLRRHMMPRRTSEVKHG